MDTEANEVVWRDTLSGSSRRPDRPAEADHRAPESGPPAAPRCDVGGSEGATRPKNPEAYDLYLRSAALSRDVEPNADALAMLERAVGLDPSYAPAWTALVERYYFDGQYGGGGLPGLRARPDGRWSGRSRSIRT